MFMYQIATKFKRNIHGVLLLNLCFEDALHLVMSSYLINDKSKKLKIANTTVP